MTNQELIYQFKLDYDKIDSFSAPELSPQEIDSYLNKGMYELIEDCESRGLESNSKITDYCKNIILPYSTSTFIAGTKPNSYLVLLPDDYRTSLLEELVISYLDCNGDIITERQPVTPISRDYYNTTTKDPFSSPWKEESYRISGELLRGNERFELLLGVNISPVTYYLDYLRNPLPIDSTINQTCELGEKAQLKIIEIAVKLAKKALQPNLLEAEIVNQKTKQQFIN